MKKKLVAVFLTSALILTSCNSSGAGSKTAPLKSDKKTSDNEVVWTLEDGAKVPEDNVKKLNEALYKKGYDVSVRFNYLKNDYVKNSPKEYHSALEKTIKEKKTDIAFCGWEYEDYPGEMTEFIRKGYFYPLEKWLVSSDGNAVYKLYDKEIWECAKIDNKNYFLPNENMSYTPSNVIGFNKKYISQDKIESWNGTWAGLLSIMDGLKLKEDAAKILGFPSINSFQDMTSREVYTYKDGLFYNVKTGEITNPFNTKGFYEYLSFLHKCYLKKYIKHGMDDNGVTDDNESEQYDTGKFAMMFNVTDDSGNADMVYKKRKFAISNDIGIGTAVCANSDKKDKALLLLKALRTDDDLANILLWGDADKSKLTDADGFVDEDKVKNGIIYQPAAIGLSDGTFQYKGAKATDMRVYKKKCLSSKLRIKSAIAGFNPDYSDLKKELSVYTKLLEMYQDCWQKADFGKKMYNEIKLKITKKSERLVKELNAQVEEYKVEKQNGKK